MSDSEQFSCTISKINRFIGLFKRNSFSLSRKQRISVYTSFIRSVIEYGIIIFSDMPNFLWLKLENVQRKAATICLNAHPRTSTSSMLSELCWESLQHRCLFARLVFIHRLVHRTLSDHLCDLIISNSFHGEPSQVTRQSTYSEFKIIPFNYKTLKYSNVFFRQRLPNGTDYLLSSL